MAEQIPITKCMKKINSNYCLSLCCVTVAGPPTITSVALVPPSTIRVYWSPPTEGAAVTGYRVNYTSRGSPQFPGSATHRSRTMKQRSTTFYLDFIRIAIEDGIIYLHYHCGGSI